jgi:rod shape determining protein RodA
MFDRRLVTHFNWSLLGIVFLLTAVGLLNLYSASTGFEGGTQGNFFYAQLMWNTAGFVLALIITLIHYRHFETLTYFFYGITIALLIMVLIAGKVINGSQSWLVLGPVTLQPTEIAKIGLILVLAKHFSQWPSRQKAELVSLIPSLLLFLMPTTLVMLQGDLGSSLFFIMIYATITLVQGVKGKIVLSVFTLLLVVSVVSYFFLLSPYQKNRVRTFMNPELDRKGAGYHLIQSKIAVGSGGWVGKGYMKGQTHKLKFIPERHTDFIFPVLAEEWGFLGASVVLVLFLIFFILSLQVAERTHDKFAFFLSVGIASLFFWHMVVNLGGVLGLMPLTGVPLPFFSYGGSALLADWVGVGLLLNMSMRRFLFSSSGRSRY